MTPAWSNCSRSARPLKGLARRAQLDHAGVVHLGRDEQDRRDHNGNLGYTRTMGPIQASAISFGHLRQKKQSSFVWSSLFGCRMLYKGTNDDSKKRRTTLAHY